MIRTSLAFDQARADRSAKPIVLYQLYTPITARLWTMGQIPLAFLTVASQIDGNALLDGLALLDGGVLFADTDARVVSFDPISERALSLGTELLLSFGETERAGFSVTVSNEDGAISRLIAEEYLLNAEAVVSIGFATIAAVSYIERTRGRVQRWRLQGRSTAVLEHRET